MNRQSWTIRYSGSAAIICLLAAMAAMPAFSQVPVDEQGNPVGTAADAGSYGETAAAAPLGAAELAELIGPVALYPDDLLAIVLPASTYPLEIVQAARFLEQYEMDSTLQPNEEWDESVTALLNYPEVLRMMNEDIDWTWQLGDAVVNQQADVIAAVEVFRDRAYAAGNLKTDSYQTVTEDDGIIEIVPANEEIIYVPYYEPQEVVVRQVTPVYYYYPRPYPVYYYPYPVGYSFYTGYFWGVTTAFRIGWLSDHLHVHHHSYWGHPYFGHSYYGHYYRRPSVQIYNNWYVNNSGYYSSNRYRDGDYWRPRTQSRARPAYYSSRTRSYRNDDVRRGDSAYGRSGSVRDSVQRVAQGSSQPLSRTSSRETQDHSSRQAQNAERQRSQPSSGRDVSSDTIRFRERSENRQTLQRDRAATVTGSGSSVRTQSQRSDVVRADRDAQRAQVSRPAATPRSTGQAARNATSDSARNSTRESARAPERAADVRRPANRSIETREVSRAARQGTNSSQPAQRTNQRTSRQETAPAVVRNAPARETREASRQESRAESRSESRGESRGESRPEQASARQGNAQRRERS